MPFDPDSLAVRVEGLDKVVRTLNRLGERELGKQVRADMKDLIGDLVVPVAQAEAPVGPTGRLKRSGKAYATAKQQGVRFGTPRTVPYAPPNHWGWPARNIARNPWVSRAVRQVETRFVAEFRRRLDRFMARATKALNRTVT